MENTKKIDWYTLAFMAFSTVWGFGNVLNGFVYFNGVQVIFSWVLMFALYFVPYALMVGELGSAFKQSGGGVSSWIHETIGPKCAYYAGWTYWACHVTYIASKGSGGLKALSWNPNGGFVSADYTVKGLIPQFNVNYFTSLSILVFAVGGCEKISPYVNKVKDPSKGFPKGMIMLAVMVMVCAILGSIAMGMMFDPAVINESTDSFKSYVSNGAYWSFQKLGEYYHVGNLLLVIYAACNAIGQFSTLVLSIDAPLRILLDNEDARQFVPSGLLKKNEHGAYINGIKMVICLSGSIILIQSFVPGAASVLTQLNKLNSVTMPLRYLWVFAAYIALRKSLNKFNPEYKFTKNQTVALVAGGWCFFVTAACCLLGMYVEGDIASTALNVITPVVLTALGLILPEIKKQETAKAK